MNSPWLVLIVAVATGVSVALMVELRLRAMRDLFRDALLQRESFDAVARNLISRQDRQDERMCRQGNRLDGIEARVSRLEGKK